MHCGLYCIPSCIPTTTLEHLVLYKLGHWTGKVWFLWDGLKNTSFWNFWKGPVALQWKWKALEWQPLTLSPCSPCFRYYVMRKKVGGCGTRSRWSTCTSQQHHAGHRQKVNLKLELFYMYIGYPFTPGVYFTPIQRLPLFILYTIKPYLSPVVSASAVKVADLLPPYAWFSPFIQMT